ncbi:MAG: xanthine phosphoribosyltransferase [Treponema sp.]|nr:xanthine phosphoribosyltransferase [Treponema sp.]
MEKLKNRILQDGLVVGDKILKVSSFLNHQIDVQFLDEIAEEIVKSFSKKEITRVLTIEASGIAIACAVARILKVPAVFCKKDKTSNVPEDVYSVQIHSFTHNQDYNVIVSKEFIEKGDKVLIVDDFLANGCAIEGLASLIELAGAQVVGAGIVIEKGFQGGGDRLREKGIDVQSMAIVEKMCSKGIEFRN